MRMWMVDPGRMCNRHLLGEHVECHMIAGTIARGKSIRGFLEKRIIEPASLKSRHDALAKEMIERGMSHNSPIIVPSFQDSERKTGLGSFDNFTVDVAVSEQDLSQRCDNCKF